MEAIAELFAAILMAVVELLILILQVIATAIALVIELAVTWIFHGKAAAAEKYRARQAAAVPPDATPHANPFSGVDLASISGPEDRSSTGSGAPIPPRVQLVLGIMIVVVAVGAVGAIWYHQELTKQRIAQTRTQIELLANGFSAQVKLPKPVLPEGKLPDRDAWGTPCELFVDKWLLGTLIVVRSWGQDTEHGTLDDLLEIQFTRPPLKVLGKNLAVVGIGLIQERIKKLLSGNAIPPENMNFKIDE